MSRIPTSIWSITRARVTTLSRQQTIHYSAYPLCKKRLPLPLGTSPTTHLHRTGLSIPYRTKLGATSTSSSTTHSIHRKMSSISSSLADRYKLVFFVPTENAEACKDAIFATGAGSFPGGKYTKCCFQTIGTGQFLPNEGANPAIGAVGAVEQCEEARIEIMCLGREVMLNAVAALVEAHPYEEVAYEVYRMENV